MMMMMILDAKIFIVIALEGLACWPDIKPIQSGFTAYMQTINDEIIVSENSFEKFVGQSTSRDMEVFFESFFFVTYVHLRGPMFSTVHTDYQRYAGTVPIGCKHFETIDDVCKYDCSELATKLFLRPQNAIKFLGLEIYGYDTMIYHFVGCFEVKYIPKSDPFKNAKECLLTCSSTQFFGYNLNEECICVENLPKVYSEYSRCIECPNRVKVFCGSDNYTSVYSKNFVQEVPQYERSTYMKCLISGTECPNCDKGRLGRLCEAINCSVNNGRCGPKECGVLSEGVNKYIQTCYCKKGYYLNEEDMACHDVNECVTFVELCAIYNGNCNNTDGTYLCKCGPGFRQVDVRTCEDVDECNDTTSCNQATSTCMNIFGYYDCVCKEGYFKRNDIHITDSCQEKQEFSSLFYFLLVLLLLFIASTGGYYYYLTLKEE